jgi:hypothetical protein
LRSRQQVEDLLVRELSRTREDYEKAHKEFLVVTSDIPSGIPHPDGVQRIKNAGAEERAAISDYIRALREFNAFAIDGKMPDRMKEP